jgi:hypothetical protein
MTQREHASARTTLERYKVGGGAGRWAIFVHPARADANRVVSLLLRSCSCDA